MSRALPAAFTALAVVAYAHTTRADDSLRLNLWVDGAVTAGAAAVLLGTQAPGVKPDTCRWCASNGLDDAARSATRWHDTRAADGLSSSLAYATLPATVVGSLLLASQDQRRLSNLPADVFVVAEATLSALTVNQVVKLATARARPRTHSFEREPPGTPQGDDNVSFFSGHTTLAFSLATAAGTVATIRRYRFADWVWASGLVLAASIGYLRMAADKHYLTDVATGALVGSAFGVGMPLLLHAPKSTVRVAPAPGGISVVGVF